MSVVVLETKGLTKQYHEKMIVDHLSFEIYQGECFGLLGPKGSGKSSALRMMYGLSRISQGDVYLLGLNVKTHFREVKTRIGIVPQEDGLENDFTVLDNLLIFSSYYQIPYKEATFRVKKLMRSMHLEGFQNQKVEDLTAGIKKRLAIARSMLHNPDFIILDEPTAELDNQSRYFVWDQIRDLKRAGKTLILSTEDMDETQNLCDRVAIMDKGKILNLGQPSELISQFAGHQVVEVQLNPEEISYYEKRLQLQNYDFISSGSRLTIYLHGTQSSQELLKNILGDSYSIRKPSLKDVFLKISGHSMTEDLVL
jgi:lipooligosaccharide transport system ATP-binding protein